MSYLVDSVGCGSLVGRVRNFWSGGRGSMPAPGVHSSLVGSVSVQCDQLRQNVMVSPLCLCVTARKINLSDVSLGDSPRDS